MGAGGFYIEGWIAAALLFIFALANSLYNELIRRPNRNGSTLERGVR
jgi:hypothetical protein